MKSISWDAENKIENMPREFFFESSGEFFESEIKKATKISLGSANSHLKALAKRGFLIHRKAGRMNFYRLDTENVIVKQMKKAYILSLPFVEKVKEAGEKLGLETYLYGSCARGEYTEKSDVDVLIIGNISLAEIEKHFSHIRKLSKRDIKISLFTRLDWISMSKKDPAFFERVEKDKIRIV